MNTKKILGVVAVLALVAVAMVGAGAAETQTITVGDGGNYSTISAALASTTAPVVTTGDTIKLVSDVSETTGIEITKAITLDLNGQKLEITGLVTKDSKTRSSIYVISGAALTITDSSTGGVLGKIVGAPTSGESQRSVIKIDAGTLDFKKGAITNNATAADGTNGMYGISVTNGGTLTVGELNAKNDTVQITSYYACISGNNLQNTNTITINCGTFTSLNETDNGDDRIYTCAIYLPVGVGVTINDGIFTATKRSVYIPYVEDNGSELTLTVNGGTYSNPICIDNLANEGTAGMTVLQANDDVILSIGNNIKAKSEGLTLNVASGKTVTVKDQAWATVKTYVNEAGTGAKVNTSDAAKVFANGKASSESVDTTATDSNEKGTEVKLTVTASYVFTVPASVTLLTNENVYVANGVSVKSSVVQKAKKMTVTVATDAETSAVEQTPAYYAFKLTGTGDNTKYAYYGFGTYTESGDTKTPTAKSGQNMSPADNVVLTHQIDSTEAYTANVYFNTISFDAADEYSGTLNFQFTVA